jgi:hypothetical protein
MILAGLREDERRDVRRLLRRKRIGVVQRHIVAHKGG